MLQILETGRALYVLAAVCLMGILTRMMTRNLYKRLTKESTNLASTRNKSLKELKQRAENTYRMNQGLRDSSAWLEHQLGELRFRGMTLAGWTSLSTQWTWLCLLLGGAGAFFSYWYRLDTYYIVLYGGSAVLMAMLTMLFDNGTASGRREQLTAALQDYLENVMCPRLTRGMTEEGTRPEPSQRSGMRDNIQRVPREMPVREMPVREVPVREAVQRNASRDAEGAQEREDFGERTGARTAARGIPGKKQANRGGRRETAAASENSRQGGADVDYLKRSLEQIAASREKNSPAGENWLKDLGPEEVQVIGDILKQYLA